MYYIYTAYNMPRIVGYTNDPKVSNKYLEILNKNREINLYEVEPVEFLLPEPLDVAFDDDTTLADLAEWEEFNTEL